MVLTGRRLQWNITEVKFPPSGALKPTELSYTNSCISEHIASSIFNMVGIKAQETLLGTYEVSGKVKVVCACRDFTEEPECNAAIQRMVP